MRRVDDAGRLPLAGREPGGSVHPGDGADRPGDRVEPKDAAVAAAHLGPAVLLVPVLLDDEYVAGYVQVVRVHEVRARVAVEHERELRAVGVARVHVEPVEPSADALLALRAG